MHDILKDLIRKFMPFAQKQIGFDKPPRLFLKTDIENAKNPLGKTAFYDPNQKAVTLYVSNRHTKDILRSLGHELVHHKQNCDGEFDNDYDASPGYAQENPHLRDMEKKANRDGSMCLRDFEDMLKKENTIYYEHLQKGDLKMSTKDWKNEELRTILAEAWGFKFNTLQEFEEFDGKGELQAESEEEVTEEAVEESTEETVEESTEEPVEELAQASASERPRQPRMQRKVDDDDDDEKKVEEAEEHDDDDKMEEGESLEEGFMDTVRGAGRKMGIGGASSSIVADAAAYYEKGAEAMQAGDDRAAVERFMALLNIGERIGAADLKKQARALRAADPKAQNPETVQQIAQLAKTVAQKAEDYVAGKKMEESDSQQELKEAIAAVLRKHLRG